MRAVGDTYGTARVLHSLAGIRHQGGALPEALNLFGEACALKRRIDQLASRSDSRV
jgi:hypothetical protein